MEDDVVVEESSVSGSSLGESSVGESSAGESLVVEVVLDELLVDVDLLDDVMVVDEEEEVDAIIVVGVVDDDEVESNNMTDGGNCDVVEPVAKTGEMATSPTNPTAEATSERRYMDTPICRLLDRSSPGHPGAGAATRSGAGERSTTPLAP